MTKFSVDKLMENKPSDFVTDVVKTLEARRQAFMENRLEIYKDEMNQLFGNQVKKD